MIANVPLGQRLSWVPWLTLVTAPRPRQSYLACAQRGPAVSSSCLRPSVCRVCVFLEAAYRTLIDGGLWSGANSEMVNIMEQAALSGSQLW